MNTGAIHALVEGLPLPVMIVGADDRIIAANVAVIQLLGPNLLGRNHISVLRQPAVISAVSTARERKERQKTSFVSRDGARDVLYRVSVDLRGEMIVISFEDRTAAEEAGQMRRDFVANVSHELRTPLTALLGFIETLGGAARDDPAARDRFLDIMRNEANRMTRLVDDLLSLSRVEEEERMRPKDSVALGGLLSSVIKGLEPQAAAANVAVTLTANDADVEVPGDSGQLMQVFTNLIENGIKYGATGGKVQISLGSPAENRRLRAEAVEVRVQDFGEGIAAHHIARLTERFYRVDTHRSREVGGTGLGLAIVKHIVNRHRGRLQIESELGKGTCVSVFLPTSHLS